MNISSFLDSPTLDGYSLDHPPTGQEVGDNISKLHGVIPICSSCGQSPSDGNLELACVDGNPANILRSNLEPICHSCLVERFSHNFRLITSFIVNKHYEGSSLFDEYTVTVCKIVDKVTGKTVPDWYSEKIKEIVLKNVKEDNLLDIWFDLTDARIKGLQSIQKKKNDMVTTIHSLDLVSIMHMRWQQAVRESKIVRAGAIPQQQPMPGMPGMPNLQSILQPGGPGPSRIR